MCSKSIISSFYCFVQSKISLSFESNINIHICSNFVWNKNNHFLIFLSNILRFSKQKQILCLKLRRNFDLISIHQINLCLNNEKWQIQISFFVFIEKNRFEFIFERIIFHFFNLFVFLFVFIYFQILFCWIFEY